MPLPAGIDPSQLPAFSLTPANDDRSQPSPIIGGLGAGFHELLGLGGSAVYGIGKLEGFKDPVGKGFADNQATIAARVGRPDLEAAPWQQGGASVAPWLQYQIGKLVPTLAGYAATFAAPEAAVPAGLARLGATLPEFLGGAGLEAGAGYAARKAALAAGTNFGKFVIGGGSFGATTGFGQAIQSADARSRAGSRCRMRSRPRPNRRSMLLQVCLSPASCAAPCAGRKESSSPASLPAA
jgi:hypothetical protein